MGSRLVTVIISFLVMLFAVSIYTDWRCYDSGLFFWVNTFKPFHLPATWLNHLEPATVTFLLYHVSDGLWMFSFSLLILAVWNLTLHFYSILWLSGAFLTGVVFEFLQSFGVIGGTFDRTDLFMYGFAVLASVILSQLIKNIKWKNG